MKKKKNLGLKPITNSTKQVMQGDGQKTWKNTKLRKGLSYCYDYMSQDNDALNSLKN